MNRIKLLCLCAVITIAATVAACSSGSSPESFRLASASQTVTVSQVAANGWFFYQDAAPEGIDNSLGSFVSGPGTPPAGNGSVEISTSGTSRPNLATYQFGGTPLADLTDLAYSTYNTSAGNGGPANRAGYLQFNVDFDGSDTWQRRLLFLPRDNGIVLQDAWQQWDTINSGAGLWRYSGPTWPGTGISGTTPRTWSDILASYPGVRIRISDPWLGIRVGEPYADGYTENLDAFVIGSGGNTTTYDFELTTKDDCKNGGWEAMGFKNQGECVSAHVSKGKK